MRKLLNTLYITNPDAYMTRDGDNIVIKVNDMEIGRRPIHILENIVCMNYVGLSPTLIKLCTDNKVGVIFLNNYGQFMGRIQGKVNGNVLLRREQYRIADNENQSLNLAKTFIIAKIVNGRKIINRALRDHNDVIDSTLLKYVEENMKNSISKIRECNNANELRGIEGDISKLYFKGINELILKQKEHFYFRERTRRPPTDNFNALLSFAYTLLTNEMVNALETVGLDPYVGFLHTDRPGRVSLALDLIEELRSYMADRFVLSLINLKQINDKHFIVKENGGVILTEDARKIFLSAWQKKKLEKIVHPFIDETIEIGLIPYTQALLLSRFIRKDIEGYPPFFVK
ncbi:MAG TPA: type I-C CRISPR-associated endonuclease Cas1c [Haloplasmataceae bacterium]